jgi:hypothetical protein
VSPILLGTILVALVSTAVVILTWYLDVTTPSTLGATPSLDRPNLIVMVGFASVAWAAFFFAVCFDVLARRVEDLNDHVRAVSSELTEEFARTAEQLIARAGELGVLHGLELSQETPRDTPAEVGPPRRPVRVQ